MKKHLVSSAMFALLICSCANNESVKQNSEAPDNKMAREASVRQTDTKIRNDIQLQTSGLKVSQAFLLYEDGTLVPPENVTNVGKPLKLRLIIDDGWNKEDGNVYIGASERIETSDGQVLLDEKDLFADMASVKAEDAKYISLTANISRLDKLYDYFLVSFRVWDKKGSGEVTGSYKLHIN
jgi:hypothetical protein